MGFRSVSKLAKITIGDNSLAAVDISAILSPLLLYPSSERSLSKNFIQCV